MVGNQMGNPSTRVALVDTVNHGLPTYTVPAPPAGPVTEMWHIQNPLNEHVPMPEGIQDMNQWGQVVVTMNKYAGHSSDQICSRPHTTDLPPNGGEM